jgi:hypothetical protein
VTWNLNLIRRTEIPAGEGTSLRFEQQPIHAITQADIEAFRVARRALLAASAATLKDAVALELKASEATDEDTQRDLRQRARALRRTAKARAEARDLFHAASKGLDVATKKQTGRNVETVAELADLYIANWAKPKKRSWKADDNLLRKKVLPRWRQLGLNGAAQRDEGCDGHERGHC